MFQYKTRGNASPQGKQRVYFTCHPEDFESTYEEITNEILGVVNCAIWHDVAEGKQDDGKEGNEWNSAARVQAEGAWEEYTDIETDLGQMQLFVIPVTARLLSTKNRTLEVDLPFALNHHIPVLPLMQESGLDDAFARRFGELQYLDKNARDDTAISYQEKLEKFLKAVLVGDEELEKIRKAFDAYIFMSYRKKDRKYANELMKLIHQHDFCRDLAIWYDEYLTPGENFNKAIEAALKKSELFTLVVTPNLVNEENYVQTTEYPMAVEAGKKVLPAEMEKTDKGELSKQYEGIPESVDAHDESGLSEELKKQLTGIAKPENDDDPEHNYLIGLAYLNGVDVEKDGERAIRLITMAAEAGHLDAMEKLSEVYENGTGTEISYKKAIEWKIRSIEELKKHCNDPLNHTWNYKLVIRYIDIYNLYRKIDQYDNAISLLGDCVEFLNHLPVNEKHEVSLAECYNDLAILYRAKNRYAKAEEYHGKAIEIRERLCEVNPKRYESDLGWSYNNLANLYSAKKQFERSEEYHKKAIEIRKRLRDVDPEMFEADLALSYNNLANSYQDQKRYAEADDYRLQALKIYERLYDSNPKKYEKDLAWSFDLVALLRQNQKQYGEAEKYYKKALDIFERLSASNPEVHDAYLAQSYYGLALTYQKEQRYIDAENMHKRAILIRERLCDANGKAQMSNLAWSYYDLGNLYHTLKRYAEAEEYFIKAMKIRELLHAENTESYESELAWSYHNLALLYHDKKHYEESETFNKKALHIRAKLSSFNPKAYEEYLALTYSNLGVLYKDENRYVEAADSFERAVEIRERLAKLYPERFEALLAWNFHMLGFSYYKAGAQTDAKRSYEKAMEIRERLWSSGSNIEMVNLAQTYHNLALVHECLQNVDKAKEFYGRALEIRTRLYKADHSKYGADLAWSYHMRGQLFLAQKCFEKAKTDINKAIEIREKLNQEKPGTYDDVIAKCRELLKGIPSEKQEEGQAKETMDSVLKRILCCKRGRFMPALKRQMNLSAIHGAINAYAHGAHVNDVLGLQDTTLFGTGKEGILYAKNGIYGSMFGDRKFIPYEEISEVKSGDGDEVRFVMKNGEERVIHVGKLKEGLLYVLGE